MKYNGKIYIAMFHSNAALRLSNDRVLTFFCFAWICE